MLQSSQNAKGSNETLSAVPSTGSFHSVASNAEQKSAYDPLAALMAPPPRSASYGVALSSAASTSDMVATDPMASLMAPPIRRSASSMSTFSGNVSTPNITMWKPPLSSMPSVPSVGLSLQTLHESTEYSDQTKILDNRQKPVQEGTNEYSEGMPMSPENQQLTDSPFHNNRNVAFFTPSQSSINHYSQFSEGEVSSDKTNQQNFQLYPPLSQNMLLNETINHSQAIPENNQTGIPNDGYDNTRNLYYPTSYDSGNMTHMQHRQNETIPDQSHLQYGVQNNYQNDMMQSSNMGSPRADGTENEEELLTLSFY